MANSEVAFIFPGADAMPAPHLTSLASDFPSVRETFVLISECLGRDLWADLERDPDEASSRLMALTAGVATFNVWREQGGSMPAMMAGFGAGEYAALVAAGALDLADAAGLLDQQWQLVSSGERGAMAAFSGLLGERTEAICELAAEGELLSVVAHEGPSCSIVGGSPEAVNRAVRMARESGARSARLLDHQHAWHSSVLQPLAGPFAALLEDVALHQPLVPVVHNCDALANRDVEQIRAALAAQLHQPVRWQETVETMAAGGIKRIVECGPGQTLRGLVEKIDSTLAVGSLGDLPDIHLELGEME